MTEFAREALIVLGIYTVSRLLVDVAFRAMGFPGND